jgi:cob(I)alamin adenosyltransferase
MARIEAGGDVDELNSLIGMLVSAMGETSPKVREELHRVQSDLFHLGAWLATTPGSSQAGRLPDLKDASTRRLEQSTARIQKALPPLKGFILPGGHASAAWAHLARTVCRRAERRVVSLAFNGGRTDADARLGQSIQYLNRLSDYLFVLARHLNYDAGVSDLLWRK